VPRPRRNCVSLGVLAAIAAVTLPAGATTELPLRYNARSLAMGGTGVAHVDDASAIAINPAGLDRIENFSATLGATPFLPRTTAPFSATRTQSTETQVVPLFFGGAALRVLDPLTTGVAVYVASGFGGHYEDVPEEGGLDMRLELAVIEVALPVAFRVTDEFAVGAALRFGHMFLDSDLPINIGGAGGGRMRLEQNLTAQSFPGVLAGVRYHPSPELGFGLTYRSKMTYELSGDGRATHPFLGNNPVDIESEFSTAHSFRAGAAWSPMPERLQIALDVAYTLFSDSNEVMPVTVQFRDQFADTRIEEEIQFHWDNSLAVLLGAEYMVTDLVAARGGYHVATMATPEEFADPLYPPPGVIHTLHAGAGLRWTHTRADLGFAYALGGSDVKGSAETPPGHYSGGYVLLGASFTYRN
jgi:long-chain fatty acid transport protein